MGDRNQDFERYVQAAGAPLKILVSSRITLETV
jgi:hypothetical protein